MTVTPRRVGTSSDGDGRVVLVTGGGAGIGEAICRMLAERGLAGGRHGRRPGRWRQRVAAVDRRRRRALDVTDAASIRRAADAVEAALGPIDAWVANAGVSSMAPFIDITETEWDRNVDVNAKGVFLVARRRRGGSSPVAPAGSSSTPRRWPASAGPPRSSLTTWPRSSRSSA